MTQIRSIKALLPRFCAAFALIAAVYSTPLRAEAEHHQIHERGLVSSSASVGFETAGEADGSPQSGVHYTCPMHPEVVSDTPGRCPHCGMKLVEQEQAPEIWRQP